MAIYAGRGAILEKERRAALPTLLSLRVWLGAVLCAIAGTITIFASIPTEAAIGEPPAGGWALAWLLPAAFRRETVFLLFGSQLAWHALVLIAGVLVSRAIGAAGTADSHTDSTFGTMLRWFGASDRSVNMIAEALMELLVDVDLVPSDVVFGLLLVGLRQKCNRLAAQVARETSDVQDMAEAPDYAAVRDLERLATFANGIYGCLLSVISDAAYEGTSLVAPHRLAAACCRTSPCLQRSPCGVSPKLSGRRCCLPGGDGVVEGDDCCHCHSLALQRAVRRQAGSSAPEVELLWGTWRRAGAESAPPFAVLADHSARELVITIRGTFSMKDCILDVNVKPEPYHPAFLAPRGPSEAPLLAHAGMLAGMRDVRSKLVGSGVLDRALGPGGSAHGYGVVCTGHSLGAGIAVLLALELRASLGEAVRYVGFEPPGCIVCASLGSEIAKLGWLSVVCAQDWAPRTSLRTLQLLREQVLDELADCQFSKAQIVLRLSERPFRLLLRASCSLLLGWRLCVGLLEKAQKLLGCGRACPWLLSGGGTASEGDLDLEKARDFFARRNPNASLGSAEARRLQRRDPKGFAQEMCCPGRLVMLQPVAKEPMLGGLYSRDTRWRAEWGKTQDLQEILLTGGAVEYHFPFIYAAALREAARALEGNATGCAALPALAVPVGQEAMPPV